MSQLYRHLLIPPDAEFVPGHESIGQFFAELEAAGAMPDDRKFLVVRQTGRTRCIGKNADTGEVYYGPELEIDRFDEIQPALKLIQGASNFDISVEGYGPSKVPPFDLHSADDYATSVLGACWEGKFEYEISCQLRSQVERVHWSAFDDESDDASTGPVSIRSPWAENPVFCSGLSHARFTVDFGIGDFRMPRITNTVDILNPHLVALADKTFGTKFTQGCRINDD
jgi:hypothetical protein